MELMSSSMQGAGLIQDMISWSNVIHFVYSPTEKNDHIRKIMLHTNDKVNVVDLEEVVLLVARRGYCEILTVNGKKYVSAKSLADYESLLAPIPGMVRVNKSHLINVQHVRSYTKGAVCCIAMRGCEEEIEVSRRKKKDIMGLLRAAQLPAQAMD